jgi:FHS family Na+ dependent glucose MFS transporter 1
MISEDKSSDVSGEEPGKNAQQNGNKPFNLSPEKRAATIGYFSSSIVFGLVSAAIGPTLPGLAENVRTSLSLISLIFTAQAGGYLLGSLMGGRLFDHLSGNRLIATILFAVAALTFFIPVVHLYWLLIAIFFLIGFMLGSLEVGSNTLMVWLHGARVGPYMNALHFFFGVGAFIAPLVIARTVSASGDLRLAYWLLSLPAIPIALWLVRLKGPKAPVQAKNPGIYPIQPLLVGLLSVLLFLYVAAEVSYGGWVFSYTVAMFGEGMADTAAILTSAFWGALTFGRLVSIPLAVRLKPSMFLIIDLAGCLASIGLIVLFPGSLPILWIGTLTLGFFMAAFFPSTVTYAGQRMHISARINSWLFVGAGAGGMVLPWVIGQLFESTGPQAVTSLIFADLLLAVVVLTTLLWRHPVTAREAMRMSEGN